jgi:hypothetical protein
MELLQNAEDNAYAEGIPPSFEIFLTRDDPTNTPHSKGCITVVNNEKGFSQADVWNLCDAGSSFKKLAKAQVLEDPVLCFVSLLSFVRLNRALISSERKVSDSRRRFGSLTILTCFPTASTFA